MKLLRFALFTLTLKSVYGQKFSVGLEFDSEFDPEYDYGGGFSWEQGCRENIYYNSKEKNCGERKFQNDKNGASPGEFPWNCVILTKEDRFLANCVIVPENSNNIIRNGTRIVSTLATKLEWIENPW